MPTPIARYGAPRSLSVRTVVPTEFPEAFAAHRADVPEAPTRARAAVPKSALDFKRAVAGIRKRDNCSHVVAMSRARGENPALFDAYSGEV